MSQFRQGHDNERRRRLGERQAQLLEACIGFGVVAYVGIFFFLVQR